jgi:hypothetical protein
MGPGYHPESHLRSSFKRQDDYIKKRKMKTIIKIFASLIVMLGAWANILNAQEISPKWVVMKNRCLLLMVLF